MPNYSVRDHESVRLETPNDTDTFANAVYGLKHIARLAIAPVRRCRTWLRRRRSAADQLTLVQHVGLTVQSGPFAGLTLIPAAAGFGPKLLGTFEREVWSAVDRIISCGARHVVNIGAAEGYYVIGLLRCLPTARGSAFETIVTHREGMRQMALANQIGWHRLEIHGTCDPAALGEALRGAEHESTVVVIDVEGAERELLNLDIVPMLRHVSVLVEIHDFIDPQISALIRERFRSTHTLTVYRSHERRTGDLPSIKGMPSRALLRLAQERRPTTMEWFWFEAHSKVNVK